MILLLIVLSCSIGPEKSPVKAGVIGSESPEAKVQKRGEYLKETRPKAFASLEERPTYSPVSTILLPHSPFIPPKAIPPRAYRRVAPILFLNSVGDIPKARRNYFPKKERLRKPRSSDIFVSGASLGRRDLYRSAPGKSSIGPSPSVVSVLLVDTRVDRVEARLPLLALAYSPLSTDLLLSAFTTTYSLIGTKRIRFDPEG